MKIIGGTFRGRKLITPEGQDIRPTTGRLRESIFSALEHRIGGFHDKRIADIFSGTGAFGLEALSRGAASATWVEKHPGAQKVLEKNIGLLGVRTQAHIIKGDARAVPKMDTAFDVIFLDPPYGRGLSEPALASLFEQGWISKAGIVVLEKDKKDPFECPAAMEIVKTLAQGFREVHFIRLT